MSDSAKMESKKTRMLDTLWYIPLKAAMISMKFYLVCQIKKSKPHSPHVQMVLWPRKIRRLDFGDCIWYNN